MKRTFALVSLLLVNAATAAGQVAAVPDMEELRRRFDADDQAMFLAPPKIHYPQTWFHFISGNVSAEGVTHDLEAIAEAGFSGIQLFHGQFGGPWPGVEPQITSLSPMWDGIVEHTAREAKRLGLRFTMQNCPGWATAGGPWIEPSNAMRHIVWSRTDVTPSSRGVTLPVPRPSEEPWRDYRDIAVLAFPTPLGDNPEISGPTSVTGSREMPWEKLFDGTGDLGIEPDGELLTIDVAFPDAITVRTLEFPSINGINHSWNNEPGITVSLDAVDSDGTAHRIMHCVVPASNTQDDQTLSLACSGEIPSARYRITIEHKHHMRLRSIRLLEAARKNNWESEAAWTLRNIERGNMYPVQDRAAFIDATRIIDLSGSMKADGTLDWTPPPGRWTILRMGHVNTGRRNSPAPPEGTGWECDKLSPEGAEAHFAGYIGRLSEGVLSQGLLDGVLIDSWECGSQTWTPTMEAEFRSRNDYDLRRWLPALTGYVIDDHRTTARFLRDWRATINDLFVDNFYGAMAALAKDRGLSFTHETAAGDVFPGDILEYYKWADVPMCEFWQPFSEGYVGSLNFKPIKPAASAARMYGKPRLAAESFTSFSHTWDEHWDMLREVANFNVAEGVSHLVYHTYTHNPQQPFTPPGTSFGGPGIGTPFLRGQTWWKYMPLLNDYFARLSYMAERGRPVSDIIWYLGDEINAKPNQDPAFLHGYKYDYCNPDILLNRLSVEGGKLLTPDGIEYSVLWLADNYRMLPETLEKIVSLVREGATVIGDAPREPATLNGGRKTQKRFDAAVKKLWNGRSGVGRVGKGRVISGVAIEQALTLAGVTKDLEGSVLWSHRGTDGADWYLVCPPKGESFRGEVDFRSTGNVEIWDPVTGSISAADWRAVGDGRTSVSLDLQKSGACHVVFRRDTASKRTAANTTVKTEKVYGPNGRWSVSFPEGWGAPAKMEIAELLPWKDLDMGAEGKAFSGTATYENTFEIPSAKESRRAVLDLGRVDIIAEVTINGYKLQALWAPPYRVDISDHIVPGTNSIKIDVTGTWYNRLAYDAGLPEAERKTWAIRRPGADSRLRESGLEGPVTITLSTPSD